MLNVLLTMAISAAAPAESSTSPPTVAPKSSLYGEPNLNTCAHAMAGIAWNNCDKDVDVFVYEDKKYKPPSYALARGKQRNDIPTGMRYQLIACTAGLQPVDAATGAFLQKTAASSRCSHPVKPPGVK